MPAIAYLTSPLTPIQIQTQLTHNPYVEETVSLTLDDVIHLSPEAFKTKLKHQLVGDYPLTLSHYQLVGCDGLPVLLWSVRVIETH